MFGLQQRGGSVGGRKAIATTERELLEAAALRQRLATQCKVTSKHLSKSNRVSNSSLLPVATLTHTCACAAQWT